MRCSMRPGLLLLTAGLALLLASGCARGDAASGESSGLRQHGLGGDFALTDQDGKRFTLARLRGKVVLLYFGYTLCPEACPMMMAKLVRVYQILGARAKDVEVVFVTIDPRRDTPSTLKGYLAFFRVPAIGLTGTREQIDEVVHRYGAKYQISDSKSAAGPLVDHSTDLYVVDPGGALHDTLAHESPPDRIAAAVAKLL